MSLFEDITLEWDGKKKTVPANDVMRMLAKVEDHLTLGELHQFRQRGTAPLIRCCMAYAAALQHAGFDVTSDAVYNRIITASGPEQGQQALAIVESLQTMMIPPANLNVKKGAAQKGKSRAANSSSKRRTKQPSDSDG